MDTQFLIHNTHLEDPKRFVERDPQLRQLIKQRFIYQPPLLKELPKAKPGIYIVGGGRQIGKTTLLKQWMEQLLQQGVSPDAIAFFSGELIYNHLILLRMLSEQLKLMPVNSLHFVIIDEITYIQDWDKGIKYAADAGLLENTILVLTGSDLSMINEARVRFPGRRGKADVVNFHLYPLSFREVVLLKKAVPHAEAVLSSLHDPSEPIMQKLRDEFQQYLLHGGYLTAINDLAQWQTILPATLNTYSDWVCGDMLRRGKQEHYLREILGGIIKRYNSQVTWNALSHDLSIDHPKTVADYCALLESFDALFIQSALLEDKLTAAPKKPRKLVFTDPFIFHAIRHWLTPVSDPYREQIAPLLQDSELCSRLVEACVATHFRRFYPTYYIKAEGEIDIAYVDKNRFWPIEVKWTNQLRSKDLKQIIKYRQAKIFNKSMYSGEIQGIKTEPVYLGLLRLSG